jgi:uncharacterized protein
MSDFLAALALVLVIEGLLFAAFPHATRRAMLEAAQTPDDKVRRVGLICAVLGVAALFVLRRVF